MKKFTLLLPFCLLMLAVGLNAQVTDTIRAVGTTGSFNTGSVNSGGTKNDGNMITINSSANRGWAKFSLAGIPAGATINSVTLLFTTYTSTSSSATNNVYGFLGDPAGMTGTALYTACGSGTSLNASSWTANAFNSKALNATGVTFVANNIGGTVNIGFVRGSTNTYNVWGYPGTDAQKPMLLVNYTANPPCSGTPTAGTASASVANACAGVSFTLTATGYTVGPGITLQWQSSPAGAGNWTNIAGATAATYSTTQTAATDYQFVVTCTNGGASATTNVVAVGQNSFQSCYCTSSATSTADEDLGNVTVGSLNNTSTCTQTGGAGSTLNMYSNYTGVTAPDLAQATTISFSLTSITCGGSYGNKMALFIDWNQDGDFTDAGEQVHQAAAATTGPHTETGTFLVPASATLGTTRMRAICVETTGTISPCGTYSWGETEDYFVNVIAGNACSGAPTPGNTIANPASACSGATINFSLQTVPTSTGNTFQWQSSPDGTTWTDIVGATNPTYSGSQTAATWYQCIVTCTNSGQSTASTPVQVAMNPFTSCYCASNATSTADEDIGNVTVGSLNNSSTCTTTGGAGSILNQYSNYTGVAAPDLTHGASVSFSFTSITCGGNYSNKFAAFIDWNQNGVYEAATETVWQAPTATVGPHTETGSFTVPVTAVVGQTGMRVINVETTGTISPCGTYTWGETEDYIVNVIAAPACSGAPIAGTVSGPATICPGATGTYNLTGYDTGTGLTFQWQESADGTTFTDVTGATTTSYTTGALSANMWYQVVVTCTNSGMSSTSNAFAVSVIAPEAGDVTGPTNMVTGLTYTFTNTGANGPIQWQVSTDNITFTNITGATSTTQTLVANVAGNYFLRVIVTFTGGCADTTNVLAITATVPQNDAICSAIDVPVDGVNHGPYSNVATTTQTGEPAPPANGCNVQNGWCNSTLNNTVWFTFVAPASGHVKVESFTVTGSTDNQLACWSALNCDTILTGGATLVAANDDANSGGNAFTAALTNIVCLTPGTTYYVQMDAYSTGGTGTYNIKITDLGTPNSEFSGLQATQCTMDAPDTLVAVVSGGVFAGPGVTGNIFDPAAAGVGTHTITYTLNGCYTTSHTAEVTPALTFFWDGDGDGYGTTDSSMVGCDAATGFVADSTDCDDNVATTYPGATEQCNGIDDDCDGTADSGTLNTFYEDNDGDSYGDPNSPITVCADDPPSNYVGNDDDCNDNDATINPGATEICGNGIDENCDGNEGISDFAYAFSNYNCASGKVTITISGVVGGTAPYKYSRNGGTTYQTGPIFTNVSPGTYTLVVKDLNGCTLSQTAVVNSPMVLSATTVPVTCFGGVDGSATGSVVSGGYPGFTYEWSLDGVVIGTNPSIGNLYADGYVFKVTDNVGCTKTLAVAITQPALLKVKMTKTNPTCFGAANGSMTATPTGGSPTYYYNWSNGATSQTILDVAGTYTCTITDSHGCTVVGTATTTNPPLLVASITSKAPKCFGGTDGLATAKATGGTGIKTFLWNTGATTAAIAVGAGTYTVSITDANGCQSSATATITQPAQLQITGINSAPSGANYTVTVTATGGTPALKYYRITNGITFNGTAAGVFSNVPGGTHTFRVVDKNLCMVETVATIPGTLKPGNGDRGADAFAQSFTLAPNPAHGFVTLAFDGQLPTAGDIQLHDATGKLVKTTPLAALNGNRLSLDGLSSGVVFVTFRPEGGAPVTKRLVIMD